MARDGEGRPLRAAERGVELDRARAGRVGALRDGGDAVLLQIAEAHLHVGRRLAIGRREGKGRAGQVDEAL